MTVLTTFWSVFLAVFMAELCKMLFERYFKTPVTARLETIEKVLKEIKTEKQ